MTICWAETRCAHCSTVNMFCLGNLDDWSQPDVEGFHCWNCTGNNEINEEGEIVVSNDSQLEEGMPKPQRPE